MTCCLLAVQVVAQKSIRTIGGKEVVLHKVHPKESWTSIAREYALTIEELKAVNPGIAELKIGQIINIPLLPEPSMAKNKAMPDRLAEPVPGFASQSSPANATPVLHTVVKGETLYSISKSNNVTTDQIKEWNSLSGTGLKLGQKIIVGYKGGSAEAKQVKTPVPVNIAQPVKNTPAAEVKQEAILENKTSSSVQTPAKVAANNATEIKSASVENPTVVKKSNGSSIVEISETGMAAWIRDGSMNQNKYFALHRSAPAGTIIKVSNRMNGDYVFVKVVGQLPESGDNDKQIVKISEAAAKKIGAINEHFQVELNYGLLQ